MQLRLQMKEATDRATILTVDEDSAPNTFRVSLRWRGSHDIADFDLERYGRVLSIQDETENTGWAIIEHSFHAAFARPLPGWAINQSMRPLTPGDTVPLRPIIE